MRIALLVVVFLANLAQADKSCALAPMKLVVKSRREDPGRAVLMLDGKGVLSVSLMSEAQPTARLDERGCLKSLKDSKLLGELLPSGQLWTEHELFEVVGKNRLRSKNGAWTIEHNGRVARHKSDGSLDTSEHGRISIEGYSERAVCPAMILLSTFMNMMPSMAAAADGVTQKQPRPAGSQCGP